MNIPPREDLVATQEASSASQSTHLNIIESGDGDGSIDEIPNNPYSTPSHRELTQSRLAFMIFWLVAGLATIILGAEIFQYMDLPTAKDTAAFILAPLVGILGTVIGFFFGSDKR